MIHVPSPPYSPGASVATLKARLPNDSTRAPDGSCDGSYVALGSSNIGPEVDALSTTVVDSWRILKAGAPVGFLHETLDGNIWYEPPIPSTYVRVTDGNLNFFYPPFVRYVACFRGPYVPPPGMPEHAVPSRSFEKRP